MIEYRDAEKKPERLPNLAADLVRLKVNGIVVVGSEATLAAKNATIVIPIIMAGASDPVLYRKFKQPFFLTEIYSAEPPSVS